MTLSPFTTTRTFLSICLLLSLQATSPDAQATSTPTRTSTTAFSASLNVTHRALQRCGTVALTSTWTVNGNVRTGTSRVDAPGSTALNLDLPGSLARPRDVTLNVALTCVRTNSVLNFSTRVSRDLPGRTLDIDVASSARSVTSLEVQRGEGGTGTVREASGPVWELERTRLQRSNVLALNTRP